MFVDLSPGLNVSKVPGAWNHTACKPSSPRARPDLAEHVCLFAQQTGVESPTSQILRPDCRCSPELETVPPSRARSRGRGGLGRDVDGCTKFQVLGGREGAGQGAAVSSQALPENEGRAIQERGKMLACQSARGDSLIAWEACLEERTRRQSWQSCAL